MPTAASRSPQHKLEFRNPQGKYRLRDLGSKTYLHFSGSGQASNRLWAWQGTLKQAETLQRRAAARGENWPFEAVPCKLEDIGPGFVE